MNVAARRIFSIEVLETRLALAGSPVITEFMASNNSTLLDGNGVASDWIEIFNKGDQPVNLAGYSLTDDRLDLDKWSFPSVTLNPGAYLVVFASGNGAPDGAGNLHTNFALSAGGEYLGLTSPGGVTLSEFGADGQNYPAQSEDVSYGLAFDSATSNPLTPLSSARYFVPTNSAVDAVWKNESFNDASWTPGLASVGYETSGNDYAGLIQTTVPAGTTSVYIRIPFDVTTANALLDTLQMKYDDGFVAYLNGSPIASANAPASPGYNSVATGEHVDSAAVRYVDFPVSGYSHLLRAGTNVLSIHLLNLGSGSSDLLAVPNLRLASGTLLEPQAEGVLLSPTPRGPNTNLYADPVVFSRPGGAFSTPFQLTLSTAGIGATIRYTTNGAEPTASSPIYSGPFTVNTTTRVRARAFGSIGQLSVVTSEAYSRSSGAASTFTSDLPIIVLENFGQGTPGGDFADAYFSLYDVASGTGRSSLATTADFTSFIGQHVRGSSTAGQPKTNLRIELRDDAGADKAASLLGMPSESDWILYAPYNFDRAMLRNTLYYDLSNQMGDYASRTRFVEVYANYNGGTLDSGDYLGVYVLMETIKRDSNRVDITELSAADITGGYILKLDRSDGSPDSAWYTERGIPTLSGSLLVHVEPERAEMTLAQRDYIRGYVQDFEDALYGPNSTDPTLGYQAYFDVEKSIDHHLLRVLSKEPDGLRLSTYLVKDAGGKLYFGPAWDFDRSAGADDDGRSNDPRGWFLPDVDFFESDWWGELFDDPNFTQKWIDRWQELRRGVLSDANILATVNGQAAEINEAQARNFARWPSVTPNGGQYASPGLTGWAAEVSHFANWLITRARWMDDQMVRRPGLSPAAGNVEPGTVVTLTSNQPAGDIYYTLDGSDPRANGGGISPAAIKYIAPFTVSQTTQVTARAFRAAGTSAPQSPWSERVFGLYSVETPADASNLRLTELHYHPADPTPAELALVPGSADGDYEFVELRNTSNSVISLNGVKISGGIDFEFNNGSMTSLQPGAYVLVVSNVTAFTARYGAGLPVVGQYSGQLSNGGEALLVSDAAGDPINEFTYDDVAPWPTAADGGGPSMEVVSLAGDYGSGANWRASATSGGNPGRAATTPGDFNADGAVNGTDFLAWQRGFGSNYGAADLANWRANFGNMGHVATASAPAALAAFAAGNPLESGPLAASPLSEGVAVDSGIISVAAFARDSRWAVVADFKFASSTSPAAGNAAAAIDAAFVEWAPQRRSQFVPDDFGAAPSANSRGLSEQFFTLDRHKRIRQSESLRDNSRLRVCDEVLESLDRA